MDIITIVVIVVEIPVIHVVALGTHVHVAMHSVLVAAYKISTPTTLSNKKGTLKSAIHINISFYMFKLYKKVNY